MLAVSSRGSTLRCLERRSLAEVLALSSCLAGASAAESPVADYREGGRAGLALGLLVRLLVRFLWLAGLNRRGSRLRRWRARLGLGVQWWPGPQVD